MEHSKIPPQAIEIEEVVLGALLLEPDAIKKVYHILKPESFYKQSHQFIYESVAKHYENNLKIDMLVIIESLKNQGRLEEVGGIVGITQLTDSVATAGNIEQHAMIVQEKYVKRELIRISEVINKSGFDTDEDVDVSLGNARREIENIDGSAFNFMTMKGTLEQRRVRLNTKVKHHEVLLSILDFDREIRMCSTGNISTITGMAKGGKTQFIVMMISALLGSDRFMTKFKSNLNGGKVVWFDTEQSMEDVHFTYQKVLKLIGSGNDLDNFEIYGLREDGDNRLPLIEHYIENNPDIKMIIIDGARDLVTSVNNEEQSNRVKDLFLKWTEVYDIHLMNVLHVNPNSDKMRGHLGTELENKSESIIMVSVMEVVEFLVQAKAMRRGRFTDFNFSLDNEYLPYLSIADIDVPMPNESNEEPF